MGMVMKRYITRLLLVVAILFFWPLSAFAQQQTYEQYKAEQQAKIAKHKSAKQKEYDVYRQKLNTEYAAFMKQKWQEFKSFEAKKKPKDQDPPTPAVKQDNTPPSTDEIRYKLVIKLVPYEVPEPVVPIDVPPVDEKPTFAFLFHDTPCSVHLAKELRFTLPDASEQAASDMWEQMSDGSYDALVSDCLKLRKELQLADWGYINLIQALTKGFFGSNSNEAVLMQMYILVQSGYAMRIARTENKWVLLMPCEATLYDYSYIYRDNKQYYILDKVKTGGSYHVFDKAFPDEKMPSLRMTQSPKLAYDSAPQRTVASARYPSMRVNVNENKNLIDFYNDYPLSSNWDYYSTASLATETKNTLYPILKREIAGKNYRDAANMLINFVQTAFNYKTDGDQFGYERPLFGDETLFYPYSDCEDRSILYSILVRELLGLEAVLLYYPGHLATAVAFPNNQSYGYHFTWKDKVFTICDPTYIGADIGECMPQFRTTSPEVIQIQ